MCVAKYKYHVPLTGLKNQTNYTNDYNESQSELNITVLAENIRTTCQLFEVLMIIMVF